MPRISVVASLVAALAGGLIAATPLSSSSAASEDPATSPEITSTYLSTETGGLSPYLPIGCAVVADFTDTTPEDGDDYAIVVNGEEQRGAYPDYVDGEPVDGAFTISIGCPGLTDGTYDVVVREYRGDTVVAESMPVPLSFRVIGHPDRMSVKAPKVKGVPSLRAGTKIKLAMTGSWERGAKISTHVWTSRTKRFTSADWDANQSGKAAVVSKDGARAMVGKFKIPTRLVGRWAWISVVARTGAWGADGVADYRVTFIPLKIAPAKR
jgi:hypothetical protein